MPSRLLQSARKKTMHSMSTLTCILVVESADGGSCLTLSKAKKGCAVLYAPQIQFSQQAEG